MQQHQGLHSMHEATVDCCSTPYTDKNDKEDYANCCSCPAPLPTAMPVAGQTCHAPHLDAADDRLDQPPHPCAGVSCTCHLDVTIQLLLAAARCTAHQPWTTPRPAGHSQDNTQMKLAALPPLPWLNTLRSGRQLQ
jgi:hypothetical protein